MHAHSDFDRWLNSLGSTSRSIPYVPVIAEIGINHNGDLGLAKALIDMASKSGCDAVKFQKRTLETVYSSEILDSPRESPWGQTQRDQKAALEFGQREYEEIDDYCQSRDIQWSASAWDEASLDFIENFQPPFHKIASALVTKETFIEKVAALHRPTLISTGMADLKHLDFAVEVFRQQGTPFALMHTVSTYPSPEDHLNLRVIKTLSDRYGVPVGYSGHEASVSPTIVAASIGASVIERHITLDRAMYGSDQSASLEESGLTHLVGIIRKLPSMLGDGVKAWAPGESDVAKKLRYWE